MTVGRPDLAALPDGYTWVTPGPNFTPDRRPVIVINMCPGQWSGGSGGGVNTGGVGNQFGLADWWFGKSPTYPTDLADTAKTGQRPNPDPMVPTHIRRAWRFGAQPPSLVSGESNPAISDQFDQLIWTLDRYWTDGFRRFVLFLPGGVSFGRGWQAQYSDGQFRELWAGHNQPMNQWQMMPAWKRTAFQSVVYQWLVSHGPIDPPQNPEITASIELYCGSPVGPDVNDPCVNENFYAPNALATNPNAPTWRKVCTGWYFEPNVNQWFQELTWMPITPCQGTATHDFDPREVSHLRYVWDALSPWKNIGVRRFWLDAASDNWNQGGRRKRYGYMELRYNPIFVSEGFRFGAETFRIDSRSGSSSDLTIDPCTGAMSPWLSLTDVACPTDAGGSRAFRDWNWSRESTEAVLWVGYDNFTMEEFGEARFRGYVLAASPHNRQWTERIKRWYHMGNIYRPDFNGDGYVNDLDWMELNAAITANNDVAYPTRPFTVFALGDYDNDGHINANDFTAFQAEYTVCISSGEDGQGNIQAYWVDWGSGRPSKR